jgi:fermentation-respiration switch protein FrsA (DUF1100 family)
MRPIPTTPTSRAKLSLASGPPRLFWVAQAVAAVVIGVPLIGYGIYALRTGTFFIPSGFHRRLLVLEHGAATLAGWGLIVAGIGAALHAGLTSIDRIKHAASSAARFAGGLALVLFIAALIAHAIG